jgi:2-polyprenyl-3-methyl-5-hydroxy-6-metoxy-1,4-benzoquinol methylase
MSTSTITPRRAVHDETFESVIMRLWAEDIQRMIDRYGDRFADVPACPACGSPRRSLRHAVNGFDYQGCHDCGAAYLSPCPPPDAISAYYEHGEVMSYWRDHMPAAVMNSRKSHLYTGRARYLNEQLRRFRPDARTLLEVGGGMGEMAEKVLELTPIREVVLVEQQPVPFAPPGVRVVNALFEEYECEQPVDVVIAFEVLEHIADPVRFAAKVRSALAPGGLFVFSTPNVGGFELATLGARSTTIMFDHLCLYTLRAVEALLARTGFEVVDLQTPGEFDVQSVRGQYEKGTLDLADNPALRFLLEECDADDRFQTFLQKNRLSSHMKCVARRVD